MGVEFLNVLRIMNFGPFPGTSDSHEGGHGLFPDSMY